MLVPLRGVLVGRADLERQLAGIRALLGADTAALIAKQNEAALDPVIAITRKWDEQIRSVRNSYENLAKTRRLTAMEAQAWAAKELAFESEHVRVDPASPHGITLAKGVRKVREIKA